MVLRGCKSKETLYVFPDSQYSQVKLYIVNASQRVSCFLIIAPEIDGNCLTNAYKLKNESKSDTDIALISASNLKWTAENWQKYASKAKVFDLEVLNFTDILDKQTLEQRMKALLS